MAAEFEKLMKKTKKHIQLLGNSRFGTGSFVFLEEKIAGSKDIRRIFYVSKPVAQKNLDQKTPLKISTVAAANKLVRKHQPKAKEFSKSSGLCAGFLHKSVDQKHLMLKIVTSKNCSESKLQKGLKALEKQYKGNALSSFVGYKAGFTADGIASSDERGETKQIRSETKKITKSAPKDPQKRIEYYHKIISEIQESIRGHIQFANTAEVPIEEPIKKQALDIRDELERASVFLGKYDRAISSVQGESSAFGTLLNDVEDAHAVLSNKLFGEGGLEEEDEPKKKSIFTSMKEKAEAQTGITEIKEGIKKGKKGTVIDGALKAGKTASKTATTILESDVAGTVASGLSLGMSIKKTIDSAGRIEHAKKAQKKMQKQIQSQRKLISTRRMKLMLERPDPKKDQDAYNEWSLRLYSLESEIESLEHLVEIQKSIKSKGAFDMLDGTLSIASGALTVSGFGSVAGFALSGSKAVLKGGKVVGEKIRNTKREHKRDERDNILQERTANKLLRNVAKKRKERGEDTSRVDQHIQNTNLSEKQQKILEEMNKIRRIRKKARHGDKLSMKEKMKLSLSSNEDAAKGMQLMRKSETARSIVKANKEVQQMMLLSIGIQPKEWRQMRDQAKANVRTFYGLPEEADLEKEHRKEVMKMLAEVLTIAIPSI